MGLLQRSNTQQPQTRRLVQKDERPLYEHNGKSSVQLHARDARPGQPRVVSRERSHTALSQERPRTAGADYAAGQSRRRAATNQDFNLEIEIPVPAMEYKDGTRLYIFPTPSPRRPPPRSATFQSSPSSLQNPSPDTPLIGLALGSPSQAAPPPLSAKTLAPVEHAPSRTPSPLPPARLPPSIPASLPVEQAPNATNSSKAEQTNTPDRLRRRKSTWKTFGSILGLRSSKEKAAEPLVQGSGEAEKLPPVKPLQPPQQSTSHAPSPSGESSVSINNPVLSTIPTSPSISRSMTRLEARANVDKANLAPSRHVEPQTSPAPPRTGDLYLRSFADARDQATSSETERALNSSSLKTGLVVQEPGLCTTPKLCVDLPDSSLDRYSVMFENLLASKLGRPDTTTQRVPTLLERRQSKKQQISYLNPLNTGSAFSTRARPPGTTPQRSNTSPHPIRTSSLSVRVADSSSASSGWKKTSTTPTHPQRPRNMKRANTAPSSAALPPNSEALAIPTSDQAQFSPNTVEVSLPPTPKTIDGSAVAQDADDDVAIVTGEMPMPALQSRLLREHHHLQAAWDVPLASAKAPAAKVKPTQLPPHPPNHRLYPQQTLDHHHHHSDAAVAVADPVVPVRIIPDWKDMPPIKTPDQIVQLSVARQISVSSARQGTVRGVSVGPRLVEMGGKLRKKTKKKSSSSSSNNNNNNDNDNNDSNNRNEDGGE